jgi:chorismate mutase/prephenate dehydratase
VSVALPEDNHEYWDLARDYFGSSLPMNRAASAMSAISALKDNKATFAVVPFPSETEDQPWWTFLGSNTSEEMNIIVSLPHGEDPEYPNPDFRALIVSKAGFDDSGEDRSFLLIQCDAENSRGGLVDLAKKAGLKARSISSKRATSSGAPAVHLMEVDDYVGKDDKRIKEFIRLLEDPGANIICVGGYPVPPRYSRSVKSPAAEKASA